MTRAAVLRVLFGLFAGSIVFSLAGMAALKLAPGIGAAVGPMLPQLMSWPTWVYVTALPLAVFAAFLPALGWGRSVAVAAVGTAIGAAAELVGTATGFPFGAYAYSDFLGVKIAGRVPYAIPPSWYAAGLLSFAFATGLGQRGARRVVTAAAFLVLWDVALDPAMSAGFPVWLWQDTGPFYGMPWVNWAGWFGTGLIIMAGLELLTQGRVAEAGPWTARIWLANGVFAVGICAVAGLGLAVLAGSIAITIPLVLPRLPARRPLREAASTA
jgi:carotene biosynthesis associated membrane protein